MVANQTYTAGTAITDFVLLEATGGTGGAVTYALTGDIPGLSFDALTRTLSGTPTAATAAVTLTYTATQGSETAPPRMFTITVIAADAPLALAVVANRSYTVGTAITDLVLSEAARRYRRCGDLHPDG